MDVTDEAVRLAAQAIEAEVKKYPTPSVRHPCDPAVPLGATMHDLARAALVAALPVERERIAQAIIDRAPAFEDIGSPEDEEYHDTLMLAARIARGES
jgi:hypothetical protein